MPKKRLTREDILNVKDIAQEEVFVSEWSGTVLVQSLSGKKRSEIMNYAMNENGKLDSMKLYPALMVAGVVEPVFEKTDAEQLNEKNSGALEKVCKVIMKLSGISTDALDETVKNA